MTTREVILDGGSPWGFRMNGGLDVQHPLRISRVNPGSKAALKGIREGDIITSINNQSTKDISNFDAQTLLKKSGDIVKLGLNEDCNGSPKRRQYNKIVQQETHSEKIERTTTSKSSYTTSSTTSTINHNPFLQNDSPISNVNGLHDTNGVSENCVVSQRSTLSSNCSSNSSAGSLSAEPQGIEILRQEARDTAARYNVINNSTKLVVTKPVSADNRVNKIDDMGGNSRSHKKRTRSNRKKSKNLPNIVGELPVEMPSSSSNSSDVTTERENCAVNSETMSVLLTSEVENEEIKNICENKLLDNVQTNYRVESPKDAPKKAPLGAIVKSKSLDNDDLKITELSSEASEGEIEDKNANECNAVVSETESDFEWEVTEELQSNEEIESNFNLGTTTTALEPENKLETVHITLITAEEERDLRDFLGGLNLVTTSHEDAITLEQKRESYKERKARKRAAIAEHFIPILQQPRYLDVINEESNDGSDKDQTDSNTSSQISSNKIDPTKNDIEADWSTFTAECSGERAEIVFLDDDSSSSDESTTLEENDDADAEESKSESISQYSSNQDLNEAKRNEYNETQIIPSSQLTPPPTPELPTPKNELIEFLAENDFEKEFKDFCADLNFGCKYLNAVSPLESRASSVSSEGSSKTQSQRTARLNSTCSSIADVADLLNNEENVKDVHKLFEPDTLREICLERVMSLPFGSDILQELAEVSKYIDNLTAPWGDEISPNLSELTREYSLRNKLNSNFNLTERWVGLPTERDDKLLLCLSPSQRAYLDSTRKGFDEAGKLLELHEKFIKRRGCNEEESRSNKGMSKDVEITLLSNDVGDNNSSKTTEFSNRLLAIIRESRDAQPISYLNVNNDNMIQARESRLSKSLEDIKFTLKYNMDNLDFINKNLSERYDLNNMRRTTSKANTIGTTGCYQSAAEANESTRVQGSVGNTPSFTNIPNRRFSLPQEFYQRQMHYIREKEKEIRSEIEKLERERILVMAEMEDEIHPRLFVAEKYRISKKGDIAIHNDEVKSQKIEQFQTELFRQKLFDEYMLKVAAIRDRKLHKVIKITSSPNSQVACDTTNSNNMRDVIHVSAIEDEFMDKVKERMRKYGLKRDNSEEVKQSDKNTGDVAEDPVLVIDGDFLKEAKELPKHLQEFVVIARQAANDEDDFEGIWSPGLKSSEDSFKSEHKTTAKQDDEPIPPVWTPRSAGSSPTLERKEFRPVNFESPTLERRNKEKTEVISNAPDSPSASGKTPWPVKEGESRVGAQIESLERRLPTSHSAPASGFTEFSTPRLPRAQNPTITLLQKAREGQLPRGASYIQTDHSYRNHNDKPPHLGSGEILYKIKKDYASDSDSERPRRMGELGSRRYEIGVGPTTKDGMPLVLRSEVKDGNQSRWYKRMYETIHKQKPDRDYVTVRYKQRRARYPYLSGYFSEPENSAFTAEYYDSDGTLSDSKYATLDRRRILQQPKENEYVSSTVPRDSTKSILIKREANIMHKSKPPGRIENYIPGRSSISEKEEKEWWDEVMDIFDGHLEQQKNVPPQPRGYMSKALKESGYESDSTLLFKRREEAAQQLSPLEQREAYKTIQKGGDVPLHGLRKLAPERPRETEAPTPPPKGHHGLEFFGTESPRKYVEKEVTIHYKSPIRQEVKESLSEEELARRQAEHMKRVYEEERRRKYLQVSDSINELQDMNNRRHTDNFIPSQKSPIPLNRYDDFPIDEIPKIKSKSPDFRLVARALYNFVGQSARELTFRKGDIIYIRRQVDKNWYEGEQNAMVGLFPANYVEIIPYDGVKSTPRKPHEGQARAKFNFIAQTHLELSLAKGELVVITRRVDDNWFEGRIGGRKGIFPVSYVEVLIDPSTPPPPTSNNKPVASPAAHSILLNGSAGGKESMGSHSYTPIISQQQQQNFSSSYRAKPIQISGANYGSLSKSLGNSRNPLNEVLHIDTHSESTPYRALYKYRPQNDDELELMEGDVVFVLEKCDDGWYVGSSQRTGAFGTFPGNYVERI